jgi:site-specific DNA recombinase
MSARRVRKMSNGDLPIDVYARISLDGDNDEEGVKRQVRDIVKSLKAQGLPIGQTFVDNDTSAYTGVERPEYEKMLQRLRDGKSGGIAGYHLKRILRRMVEMEDLIAIVEQTGIRVITIASSELDLNSASGRAIGRILAAFGQMEVEEISERMQAYFADRAGRGEPHRRGRRPFGYNDDWLTLHPVEGPAYRKLFDQIIAGSTLSEIADQWERAGIVDRNGHRFPVSNIRAKILAPRARGAVTHQGEVIDGVVGKWEPVVSADVQQAAIAALKMRRTHLKRTTNGKRPARLLSGLLICDDKHGGCGNPLRVRNKRGDMYVYKCDRHHSHGCGKVAVVTDVCEAEVEKRFLAVLTDPKVHKKLEQMRRRKPDTQKLVDEVRSVAAELDAADRLLEEGDLSPVQYQKVTRRIKERLAEATDRLEIASCGPNLLAMDPAKTAAAWPKLDPDERRRRLAAWIEIVRVKPLGGPGGPFRPDRIRIDWRI